jgi:peptidoglycan/LPS O-acetylase OafA/YrhL
LDGWRAIAILGVLISHDLPWTFLGHTNAKYKAWGASGIYLFFAISGFLITTRILDEERLRGSFSIRRFYTRRLFRIQPAAVVYLAVVAVLMGIGVLDGRWYGWFSALFLFLNNTIHTGLSFQPSVFGHFWTLSVEEHFYILLSLMLVMVKRRRMLLLGVAFLVFWLLAHVNYLNPAWDGPVVSMYETQWNLYILLLASFMAVVMRQAWAIRFAERLVRPWVMLLVTFGLGMVHQLIWHGGFLGAAYFVVPYLSIFWVISTAYHPVSLLTRLLETPPLRFVGRISYSLYLWHVLFFFFYLTHFAATNPVKLALSVRAIRWAVSFAVATLSYYFIERPMIRVGHRLAPPATAGHADLSIPEQSAVSAMR